MIDLIESIKKAGLTLIEIPADINNKPTKAPILKGWNKPYSRDNLNGYGKPLHPGLNVNYGLLHSASNTVAFDIDDMKICHDLLLDVCGLDINELLTAFDRFEIKSPKKNRGKLIFRLPEGVSLSTVKKLQNGNDVIFELRGGPNQDVIIGNHPEGGEYKIIGDPDFIPLCPDALLNMALNWDDWRPVFESFFNPGVSPKEKTASSVKNNDINLFNDKFPIRDVLLRNGYKPRGNRFIRPNSSSGAPGIVFYNDYADGVERIFSQGGDDLANGHAHDSFNCYKILECGGDFKKAINWNGNNVITPIVKKLIWEKPAFKIIINKTIKPFDGVMNALVKQVLRIANKPQPELTILSALIGMASSIGGNYQLRGGARLNLYGVGISGTGTGKDKAMRAGTAIADMAGSDLIGKPGSGAGLEDSLSDEGTKMLIEIDEVAHFITAINDQKQTNMASIAEVLLKLFSASRHKYTTRRLAASSLVEQKICVNPCVSLLGFACPEKLGESFGNSSNIEDGLIGRFLFANGREGVKGSRDKDSLRFSPDMYDYAERLKHKNNITIEFTDEADTRLDKLIDIFDATSVASTNPFARNLKARSFEKCEKIAGVLAVWGCPEKPVITLDHVNWAEEFMNYSDDAILKFTEKFLHGGQVQSHAAKIEKTIAKFKMGEIKNAYRKHDVIFEAGFLPRSSILTASKLSKKDFDAAIDYLVDREKLVAYVKDFGCTSFKVLALIE